METIARQADREREVTVYLIGEYEKAMNNAAWWRNDIKKLLDGQNDKKFIETITDRLVEATDKFTRSMYNESLSKPPTRKK